MKPLRRWMSILCAAALLAACASTPQHPSSPVLRLSPASLGRTLALQQQLTVETRGATHRVEVLLEADSEAVRLAVVNMGQTAARLEWDGKSLDESRAPWWPAAVGGERILSDLQLMLWPACAIRGALPQGWALVENSAQERLLQSGGQAVVRVQYLSPSRSSLENLRDSYRITVDSRVLGATP
jgi:hypothetical protein